MKKYRNSIVIVLIAVLSLSVFYVNQTFSSSNLPDFYIKQTSGDTKLLDQLELEADYEEGMIVENVKVTKEGSKYLSESSYFERLDYWEKHTDTAEMKELSDQYSSFMRGKNDTSRLYNDSKQVIYVDADYDYSASKGIHNYRLKIDSLDKKTEDKNSFEVNIPNQENLGYMDILDVQIIMDELRVVTISERMDEGNRYRIHEYTINLKKEKLIDDHSILITDKRTENQNFYTESLTDITPTQGNTHFIFKLNQNVYKEEESDQTVASDLYAYNYKTSKLAKIELPADLTKELLENGEYYLAYDHNSLYASTIRDNNGNKTISMLKYDFEEQKITKNYTIPMDKKAFDYSIKIYQNKMIFTFKGEHNQPFIKIFNFDDGKPIFEAKIEAKNQDQKVFENFMIYEVNGL